MVDEEQTDAKTELKPKKKTSFRRKKKSKETNVKKTVDFVVDDDAMKQFESKTKMENAIMKELENKSNIGSICLVLDTEKDTISVYSGN